MKKILHIFLACSILCTVLCISVSADSKNNNSSVMDLIYTDLETEANSASAYATPRARGAYLAYGSCEVRKLASDEIGLHGETAAFVDSALVLNMYLERKVGDVYSTYKYWKYTANDALIVKSLNVFVPSGYFYRLVTNHSATKGNIRESVSNITKGIYIGK